MNLQMLNSFFDCSLVRTFNLWVAMIRFSSTSFPVTFYESYDIRYAISALSLYVVRNPTICEYTNCICRKKNDAFCSCASATNADYHILLGQTWKLLATWFWKILMMLMFPVSCNIRINMPTTLDVVHFV
jgi:hypothetical protein